jgi:hypothetical protein
MQVSVEQSELSGLLIEPDICLLLELQKNGDAEHNFIR